MAATFSSFLLVVSLMVHVGFTPAAAAATVMPPMPSPVAPLPCLQKLLPCQPYLKPHSTVPPACCIPMNELVKNEMTCLCQMFNNADLLKSLNVTQDDALQLAKECHANPDTSLCKNVAVPPNASPVIPAANNSSSVSPPKSDAIVGVESHWRISAAIAIFLGLALSNVGFA